jgi:WD40 repeat protein
MHNSNHTQQPCFQLRKVASDGQHTERICSLTEFLESASKVHLDRRAFLGVSSLTMLAALAACSSEGKGDTLVEATEAAQPTADVVEKVAVSAPEMDCEQIRAHVDAVVDLCFSPDSRILVSTSMDNSLKLWDLESRNPPLVLDEQGDTLTSPIFTQDGKILYWLWPPQKLLNGYDVATQERLEPLEDMGGEVWIAAFNPDETLLAVAGENLIELWDFPARRRLWGTPIETIFIGLVYSPQDDTLYTGDLDGFIRQWDMETGEMLNEFISESGIVLGLSISPDGKYLAWGGVDDNFVHLWDLAAGEEIESWNAPGSIVSLTAFSPDGRWLAVSGEWNEIVVIDLTTLRQEYMLSAPGNEIRALSFSPDSQLLAAGTDIGSIVFWNTDSFEQINDAPDDCLFDPDAAPAGDEFNTVRVTAADGITRTYTLPCGSPIPAGAICTCDCVPGTFAGELPTIGGSRPSGSSGGRGCSCDEVCTCVPVCVCMAV